MCAVPGLTLDQAITICRSEECAARDAYTITDGGTGPDVSAAARYRCPQAVQRASEVGGHYPVTSQVERVAVKVGERPQLTPSPAADLALCQPRRSGRDRSGLPAAVDRASDAPRRTTPVATVVTTDAAGRTPVPIATVNVFAAVSLVLFS